MDLQQANVKAAADLQTALLAQKSTDEVSALTQEKAITALKADISDSEVKITENQKKIADLIQQIEALQKKP